MLDLNTSPQRTALLSSGPGFELIEKVTALQAALLSAHPTLPVLLRNIHTQLRADPEITTLLSEDEIGIIVNGLKRQTQVELVTTTAKPKSDNAKLKSAIKNAGGSSVDLF